MSEDDPFEERECGPHLLKMREMSREIEQSFRILEVRGHNPIDGGALGNVSFQQGPRGHHEIAHAGPCGLLSSSRTPEIASCSRPSAPRESATCRGSRVAWCERRVHDRAAGTTCGTLVR